MRKAFDANVPKLKPRLRSAAAVAPSDGNPPLSPTGGEGQGEGAGSPPSPSPAAARLPAAQATAPRQKAIEVAHAATSLPSAGRPVTASARSLTPALSLGEGEGGSQSVTDRRDRLDKIKRRVAEAARPRVAVTAVPADPARAAESVLGLIRELEADLAGARDREEALRADLEASRAEATRAGAEARQAVERLGDAERQLEEKRGVLSELLAEMGALEAERDEALRRSQALAALDEERARLLEDVTRRADDEARLRGEREAEVERLSEELRAGAADGARLRAALSELARERDDAAGELDRIRQERDELASAKRALEQVHTALAQARARLG